jgi:hypothetical protein
MVIEVRSRQVAEQLFETFSEWIGELTALDGETMAGQFVTDPRFNDVRRAVENEYPWFYCVLVGRLKYLFTDR